MGHFREENIVLCEVTVQSGKLLFPKEILFGAKCAASSFAMSRQRTGRSSSGACDAASNIFSILRWS